MIPGHAGCLNCVTYVLLSVCFAQDARQLRKTLRTRGFSSFTGHITNAISSVSWNPG
jgi:hypothetical protein